MKKWIPSFIKERKAAHLLYMDKTCSKALPILYTYKDGHLVFPLSIINPTFISHLRESSEYTISIIGESQRLNLYGKLTIGTSIVSSGNHEYSEIFKPYLNIIPHLSKILWCNFNPDRIQAYERNDLVDEIVLEIL